MSDNPYDTDNGYTPGASYIPDYGEAGVPFPGESPDIWGEQDNDYQDEGGQDYYVNDYDVTKAVYDSAPIGSGIDEGSFWEDPVRIGRYKHAMDSAGPDWMAPEWMPAAVVNQLYETLKDINGDKPFYQWDKSNVPDNIKDIMRAMPVPPPDVMNDDEAWQQNMRTMGYMPRQVPVSTDVYTVAADKFNEMFPGVTGYPESNGQVILTREQADNLISQLPQPEQKPVFDVNAPENQQVKQPTTWENYILPGVGALVSTGGMAMVGGAVGGIPGMIAGGVIGAGLPVIAGLGETGGNEWYNQPAKAVGELLRMANVPAEETEKLYGAVIQAEKVGEQALEATRKGQIMEAADAVGEYLANIGAAYQAGALLYEGSRAETTSLKSIGINVPLIANAINPAMLEDMGMEEARKRIIAGEAPADVIADIGGRYGTGGALKNMAYQMIFDPLNLIGYGEVKAIGKIADLIGNAPLAKAAAGAGFFSDPLELAIKYTHELRGLAPEARYSLGAVDKLVGGLDNLGQLKSYGLPKYTSLSAALDPKNGGNIIEAVKVLFGGGLTPVSRANYMTNNYVNGIGLLLEREQDPKTIIGAIKSLASMTPEDAVKAADSGDLPQLINGAELQHLPEMLKDNMKAVDEVAALYENSRDNKKFLDNISGILGETPTKLMRDISRAPETKAKAIAQEAIDSLTRMSQDPMTDPKVKAQAQAILEGGNRDAIASQLQSTVKMFTDKDGAPYDATVLKSMLINTLADGAGKFSADYFGIEPASRGALVGNIIKQTQGYLMLGVSPTYLMNNVLNNVVMLAWDGLLGYHNFDKMGLPDEFGTGPMRFSSGIAPLDVGETAGGGTRAAQAAGLPITTAQRRPDSKLQGISDWMKGGGWAQPMQVLSGKAEAWASRRAEESAFRSFYYGHWKPGLGYDALPPKLARDLDTVQPGLSETVKQVIASAKKAGDMQKVFASLGEGVNKIDVPDVMSFANKEQSDILAHMPDLIEDANTRLAKAKTPEARRQVFSYLRDDAQGRVNEQVVANVEKIVSEQAQNVMVSGIAGAADGLDQISRTNYDFWINHFKNMDDMFEKADTMTPKARRIFINHELDLSGKSWNTQQNIEGAKLLGIIRGLGEAADYDIVKQALFDKYNTWRGFYNERSRMVNEYYDWRDTAKPKKDEAGARWAEIQARLDEQYVAAFDIEADAQSRVDARLADLLDKQGIPREQTMNWRGNVSDVRETMRDAIRYFRSGQGTPAEPLRLAIDAIIGGGRMGATKSQQWDRFINEVYNPLIAQHMQASTAPRVDVDAVVAQQQAMLQAAQQAQEAAKVQAKPPEAVKPEQPVEQPPVELTPEAKRSQIRQIAKDYGVTADRHMKNIAGQPDGKLEDIDPEQFRAALEARKAEKAKPREVDTVTDLEKQLNVEPVKQEQAIQPTDRMIDTSKGTTYAMGADPNNKYEFKYRIVDASDLITSHTDTFQENPNYPPELQPRDRERAGSKLQVEQIGKELNPDALLVDTHQIDRGPMIIGSDNVVESGNGRALALRNAIANYPDNYNKYVSELKNRLADYGMTESDLEGITNPVLVRERVSDVDRVAFTAEANQSNTMRMATSEMALQDAKNIKDTWMTRLEVGENQTIDQALKSTGNADLVRSFVGSIPDNERAAILDASGNINTSGIQRLKDALFAKAYGGGAGERLLKLFSESIDPGIGNFKNAMYSSLAQVNQAEGLIAARQRSTDLSITDDIAQVVDVYARLKQQNYSVTDYLGQMSMFDQELNSVQQKLLAFLNENSRSPKNLREFMLGYANKVIEQPDVNQMGLFGETRVSKGEILDGVASKIGKETGLFAGQERGQGFAEAEGATKAPPAAIPPGRARLAGGADTELAAPIVEHQNQPIGTFDSVKQFPPVEEAAHEFWMSKINPMLKEMEDKAAAWQPMDKIDSTVLPKETLNELKKYLAQQENNLADTKAGAMRFSDAKRDFALLNYGNKTFMDSALSSAFPYQFWYTHTMLNWALRAMVRPNVAANFERMRSFVEDATDREGFPYRLKNKLEMNIPFMPEWMGGKIYTDPMKQVFPFMQMARPWEQLAEQKNTEQRKTESAIKRMVEDEEITPEEGTAALRARQGPLWDKATSRAKVELEEDIRNPADFLFSVYSPALPTSIAYDILSGRPDHINSLPITKLIQNATAAAGIGGARGVNIEEPFRRAAAPYSPVPLMDKYEDYRVDRMLANLTAEGKVTPDAARRAMMDRTGPEFEMAQRRVSQAGLLSYIGAPMGVDIFPEGEREMRGLADEYNTAIASWKKGDNGALTAFYDKYPEYQVRQDSFKDPEERQRAFLRSEIWQRYMGLPDAQREEVRNQLGQVFQDNFLNKETHSYDSINTETYGMWAQALGTQLPEAAGNVPQVSLKLMEPKLAADIQAYQDEKDKLFPGIYKTNAMYYNLPDNQKAAFEAQYPQVKEYQKWNTDYLAGHSKIIPHVIGEQSELAGQPADVQKLVYQYRATRENRFGNNAQLWDQYNAIPGKEQKRAFWDANPSLKAELDFSESWREKHPKILPFITSEDAMRKMVTGDIYLPKRVQQQVDAYYQQKDNMFPGISQKWDEYFALTDKTAKREYWRTHPELQKYSTWSSFMAETAMPEAAPYIKGQVAQAGVRMADYDKILKSFSPELSSQVLAYAYMGTPLSSGARKELNRLWSANGQPGGTLEDAIEDIGMIASGAAR